METSLARDLMSDEEWAFHERFILAIRAPNGRKPTNHRLVLDGIFWSDGALLHKSADGRTAPIPGQTYPATFVTGMPSTV
jgi:hypothetical protein